MSWLRHAFSKLAPTFSLFTSKPLPDTLVCLDTETTSLNVNDAQLLSIGAVRIRNGVIQGEEKFDVLVKRDDSDATDHDEHTAIPIHRILPQDSQQGIPLEHALSSLRLFIGHAPITGYNIDFDRKVLEKHLGTSLKNDFIEVSDQFLKRETRRRMSSAPGGHIDLSFDHICETLNVPVFARHSALGDAMTTAMVYLKLR
ncbi:exonuclease domain-containing protein [Litoribrevibacter euphylliae]|uniref:Exonuclease domain-containing protein n=1 Tax=Litoribrevibacter euphylliae TaxID=1834034 RepID=A0ABV7HER9_9GAMM